MLFDTVIAYDHLKQKIDIVVNMKTGQRAECMANYGAACARLESIAQMIAHPAPPEKSVTVFQRLPRKPAERLPGSPHHQSFALHGLPMYGRYGDYEHLTGDSGPFKGRTAHHISGGRVQAQGRYAGGGRQAGKRASGR